MEEISPAPDTFNARWVSPERVAESFVPVPQFRQLLHNSNSLLLGPRGCGKTTLLKMLTRSAQTRWQETGRAGKFTDRFQAPSFEAIYIPSDVRWSFEVRAISEAVKSSRDLTVRSQRTMVAINTLVHVIETLKDVVGESRAVERRICQKVISLFRFDQTLPTFSDVIIGLESLAASIRGAISKGDAQSVRRALKVVPDFVTGHALDPLAVFVRLVAGELRSIGGPCRWALCYDELEIAPEWLRIELIEALRSGPQALLLKLTWTPILPSGVSTAPETAADFRAIRLWHSHVQDPKAFCEDLARDFLRRRFGQKAPSPAEFFRRSVLACEEEDEPSKAYERGSTEYLAFKQLATWDRPFRALMIANKINPEDPVPRDQKERDEFFRKVKPIVLLRAEFGEETKGRSRKAPALYVGREAIYAISEGNPRWLLSILTDLVDFGLREESERPPAISYADQGRILSSAAQRFRALLRASPFQPPETVVGSAEHTLWDFVELLGNYFRDSIHNRVEFREDPIGSFDVPEGTDVLHLAMISQLLEIGALVYVGLSQHDVPRKLVGSRFRLSFMLAPIFRLPFRNLKAISLREILLRAQDANQLSLPI